MPPPPGSSSLFKKVDCFYFICMGICHCVLQYPLRSEEGIGFGLELWILGIKPVSSTRPMSALNEPSPVRFFVFGNGLICSLS